MTLRLGPVKLRLGALPTGLLLPVSIVVAAVLVWRVLAVGVDALTQGAAGADDAKVSGSAGSAEAEAGFRERIARNPADASALLALALELERQGKREEAGAAMREAAKLAPADPQSLLLVAGYFLRTGEDGPALATLRRAIDSAPGEVGDRVWPVFTAALVSGRHRVFFETLVRESPAWWPEFFRFACTRAANTGALQGVFAARVAGRAATLDERRCMIERLQREVDWAGAYLVWLNGLPVEQRQRVGFVFNGGFELPLSNFGFDWRIPEQTGAVVSAEPGDGATGQLALSVAFENQRYGGPPLYQYLVLAPGRYRLDGRVRSDLDSWLGLQWSVYCKDTGGREVRQLAHSDAFRGPIRWREFRQDFVVPATCPAQVLRLELANPKPGAEAPGSVAIRLKGNIRFDDLKVRIVD